MAESASGTNALNRSLIVHFLLRVLDLFQACMDDEALAIWQFQGVEDDRQSSRFVLDRPAHAMRFGDRTLEGTALRKQDLVIDGSRGNQDGLQVIAFFGPVGGERLQKSNDQAGARGNTLHWS